MRATSIEIFRPISCSISARARSMPEVTPAELRTRPSRTKIESRTDEGLMDAEIIKRVVRAIAERSQGDLERLAGKIVDSERRVGHNKLADQLDAILKQPRPRTNGGNA